MAEILISFVMHMVLLVIVNFTVQGQTPILRTHTQDVNTWSETDFDLTSYNHVVIYLRTCTDGYVDLGTTKGDNGDSRVVAFGGHGGKTLLIR